jgi:hypothetical protein
VIEVRRLFRVGHWIAGLCLLVLGAAVFAQIEAGDRKIDSVDRSSGMEVNGIEVDVGAKSADVARFAGWREAQRKGWRLLWAKYHGGGGAPGLSDGALDSIVSSIVVEDEQLSTNRYIAKLGIVFDRVRAAEILGVGGASSRSAPLLLVPILWSGGTPVSFEQPTEWRKAWARYNTENSAIDYVRPNGTGADPLLLTFGQTHRPGRRWWRALLDQYGVADVVIPSVQLERQWPGGPIIGRFSARYGPDNKLLETFTLQAASPAGLAQMMDVGVARIDGIYSNALAAGLLRPDRSLILEQSIDPKTLEAVELAPLEDKPLKETVDREPELTLDKPEESAAVTKEISSFTIQFDSPDEGSVSSTESSVSGIPGVKSASTTSLALGGTSVMRVSFAGDAGMLKLGLAARGFSVSESGGVFRISR